MDKDAGGTHTGSVRARHRAEDTAFLRNGSTRSSEQGGNVLVALPFGRLQAPGTLGKPHACWLHVNLHVFLVAMCLLPVSGYTAFQLCS